MGEGDYEEVWLIEQDAKAVQNPAVKDMGSVLEWGNGSVGAEALRPHEAAARRRHTERDRWPAPLPSSRLVRGGSD